MRFEIEKKRIGIRLIWEKTIPIFGNGFELVFFPPKGLPWYKCLFPYRYRMEED